MSNRPTDVLSPRAAAVHGWATILAPLLLLASSIAFITLEGGVNNGVLGGTIGAWSCFAFAIGLVGIYRMLEPTAPQSAPVMMAIALIGWVGGVAFNVQAMYLASTGVDFLEEATGGSNQFGILAFLPWGWFAPLAFVLTGLLLWRTGTGTRWSATLLVVGGALFVTGRPARIDLVVLAADTALVLALVPLGWAMVTRATRTATDAISART